MNDSVNPVFKKALEEFHNQPNEIFKIELSRELPNGLESYTECLYQIALHINDKRNIEGTASYKQAQKEGTAGLHDLARIWAIEFENLFTGTDHWIEKDWYEELERFLEVKELEIAMPVTVMAVWEKEQARKAEEGKADSGSFEQIEFKTVAEAKAFMQGVEQSNGWESPFLTLMPEVWNQKRREKLTEVTIGAMMQVSDGSSEFITVTITGNIQPLEGHEDKFPEIIPIAISDKQTGWCFYSQVDQRYLYYTDDDMFNNE